MKDSTFNGGRYFYFLSFLVDDFNAGIREIYSFHSYLIDCRIRKVVICVEANSVLPIREEEVPAKIPTSEEVKAAPKILTSSNIP